MALCEHKEALLVSVDDANIVFLEFSKISVLGFNFILNSRHSSRPRWINFNTLRPRQNGRHDPDDIFKCIILSENVWILIKISLKFVPKGPINNLTIIGSDNGSMSKEHRGPYGSIPQTLNQVSGYILYAWSSSWFRRGVHFANICLCVSRRGYFNYVFSRCGCHVGKLSKVYSEKIVSWPGRLYFNPYCWDVLEQDFENIFPSFSAICDVRTCD